MFNKRKQKREQEQNANQMIQAQFLAEIESADQIKDPAEKIVRLQRIRSRIIGQLQSEDKAMTKKADRSEERMNTGGNMILWAGLIASGVVTGPLVGAALAAGGVGYVGALAMGVVREKSVKKKLVKKSLSHTETLNGLHALVGQMIGTTMEQQRATALDALKKLSDGFSTATEKPAAEKTPAAEPTPPAEPEAPRVQTDYKILDNVLRKKPKPRLEP